jgi:hypothetical protein
MPVFNWIELTLRYLVDPRQRRAAASFIFTEVFHQIEQRKDIAIASSTMDVTVHREKIPSQKDQQDEQKAA